MALVPIIQPPVIKLLTSRRERQIKMEYSEEPAPRWLLILFPIIVTLVSGIIAPMSVSLVGLLMFGNLMRVCGVLEKLSLAAQNELSNLVTLLLGITIGSTMTADAFLRPQTIMILGMGLLAFVFGTATGVIFGKIVNIFAKKKINPMIGAAGISAFPMSGRVVHKMGLKEDPQNFLLMHSIGVNVSGQIASVIAGGLILNFFM
jgi:oxaloacetate decarboxylase beta subunit